MKLKSGILLFFLLVSVQLFSQGIGVGQWRDHLPYLSVISVCEADNIIYAATPYSLIYYNKSDNSIGKLNKVNGLSDIGISCISYSNQYKTLIITYKNANIDLIKDNIIINIPDIKRKPIYGNKSINKIRIINQFAYLMTGFGIVVLDLNHEEIKDTYYLSPEGVKINVFDLTLLHDSLFAATDKGLYKANISNLFLSNYENWQKITNHPRSNDTFNIIVNYHNKIYVNACHKRYNTDTIYVYNQQKWEYFNPLYLATRKNLNVCYDKLIIANNGDVDTYDSNMTKIGHIYTYVPEPAQPNDAICDKDGIFWIADNYYGLIKNPTDWSFEKILFEGPQSPTIFSLNYEDGCVFSVPGGHDESWAPLYKNAEIYSFTDEKWSYFNNAFLDSINDIVRIAIDKGNKNHFYAASWGSGVVEFQDGNAIKRFTQYNSSLQTYGSTTQLRIAGIATDKKNNLWISNSLAFNALSVKTPDNQWKAFYIGSVGELGQVLVDDIGQKWIISRSNGIIVFNDNNTLNNTADDHYKLLTNTVGIGALPSKNVWCIAKDIEGQIWVGTDIGVAVFTSPGDIFSTRNFDATRILVELDGFYQYLLEFEVVTSIAVDGSNKKWIGTQNAGVFLVSADGTKQLQHFTTENSPLLSNDIKDITINQETGEVFFGTAEGLISYKGNATQGNESNSNVYAYPNPVKSSYDGYISIKGLVGNANVKITDISGMLVFETKAEGGQAIWNGRNFRGEKVQTGVYLVFVTNDDGSETIITKILFVN